jgi:hypothetical protein
MMNRMILSFCRNVAIVLTLAGLSGCALHPIVYLPNAPLVQQPEFPLRVAVLPFKDGTKDEPFHQKSLSIPLVVLNDRQWTNIAKAVASPAYFPPKAWGKALATELQASGLFKEARFETIEPVTNADILIEGTVNESTLLNQTIGVIFVIVTSGGGTQDFSFTLRARRPDALQPFWETTVERHLKGGNSTVRLNAILRGMMAEATQQLKKALETLPH